MKQKQNLFVAILLLLLLVLIPARGLAAPPAPIQEKEEFWRGNISNQKEAFIKIVETRNEWDELWLRALERPAPKIDFTTKVVACVFLGYEADWLYSIHVGEPVRCDNEWIVPYGMAMIVLELAGPFRAGGQYVMKVLEKKNDAPMILQKGLPEGRRR